MPRVISLRHGALEKEKCPRPQVLFLLFGFVFASLALQRSPPPAPSPIPFKKDSARKTNKNEKRRGGGGPPESATAGVPERSGGVRSFAENRFEQIRKDEQRVGVA